MRYPVQEGVMSGTMPKELSLKKKIVRIFF